MSWGKGCTYITDWLKPILPFFPIWLHYLKFLIPIVEFHPPPLIISQVTPMCTDLKNSDSLAHMPAKIWLFLCRPWRAMIFNTHVKKWRHAQIIFRDKFVTFANPGTHLCETHVTMIRMGPFCGDMKSRVGGKKNGSRENYRHEFSSIIYILQNK